MATFTKSEVIGNNGFFNLSANDETFIETCLKEGEATQMEFAEACVDALVAGHRLVSACKGIHTLAKGIATHLMGGRGFLGKPLQYARLVRYSMSKPYMG